MEPAFPSRSANEEGKSQPRSKQNVQPSRRRASKFAPPGLNLDDSAQAEAERLRHLAGTWPATCKECDQEFRYEKGQAEPERCPRCSSTTYKCRLCGRPFESKSPKDYCSARCEEWESKDSAVRSRTE